MRSNVPKITARAEPVERRLGRSDSWRSPVRRFLTSTVPAASAARADDELPGRPIRSIVGEFGARRFVAVVVEHVDAGVAQLAVELVGGVAAAWRRPARRLTSPTWNGATLSGQMMPASSWLASMIAPTSRDTPMP